MPIPITKTSSRLLLALTALIAVNTLFVCHASGNSGGETSVSSTFPRWGSTPETLLHSWNTIGYNVTNNKNRAVNYIFAARPKGQNGITFENVFSIGPDARCSYSIPIISYPVSNYRTDVRQPGKKPLKQSTIPFKNTNAYSDTNVFFLNDDSDISGISALQDKKTLIDDINHTTSTSSNAPQHMLDYGGASIVVGLDMSLGDLDFLQWQALKNYVAAGGTLVIAHPQTAVELSNSPLEKLLPFTNPRKRPITHLPIPSEWQTTEVEASIQAFYSSVEGLEQVEFGNNGTAILEGELKADALTTATSGNKPFFVWKRYGFGEVGVCNVMPFNSAIRKHRLSNAVWNHILSSSTTPPFNKNTLHSKSVKNAMTRLAGFDAPAAGVIHQIITLYLALIALILVLGIIAKKRVVAWLVAGAASIVLSATIIATAYKMSGTQLTKSLTGIKLACLSPEISISEENVSLFSKSDLTTYITGSDQSVRLRPNPPPPIPISFQKSSRPDFYTIRYKKGITKIPDLNVRALKSTQFSAFNQQSFKGSFPRPVITNTADSLQLKSFDLPPRLPQTSKAFLVSQNGIFEAVNKSGTLTRLKDDNKAGLEASPLQKNLCTFLANGRLPSPAIALLSSSETKTAAFSMPKNNFPQLHHNIQLFSVTGEHSDDFNIPAQQIGISPASTVSRALQWKGKWQQKNTSGNASGYSFIASLPRYLNRNIDLEEVTVNLSIFNPTGAVKPDVRLLPWSGDFSNKVADSRGIQSLPRENNQYHFKNLGDKKLLNPVTNSFLVKIIIRQKPNIKVRNAKWQILNFSITADAHAPEK